MEVVVPLAKLEQPELAKLTLFVRGQEGASTPAVSCNDSITIELHGTDEQGNRRRIDLADFDACTKLVLSDLPADVVQATQSPWAQSEDGLEMTVELGGKAGELDIELDPGHMHYGICDTLHVKLIAGEPDKVVASLASGDATETLLQGLRWLLSEAGREQCEVIFGGSQPWRCASNNLPHVTASSNS